MIARPLPALGRFLSLLGRNSLHVFCAGSVLSLCGQIVRFVYGGSRWIDLILFVAGVGIMALIAWLAEWRTRSKAEAAGRVETARAAASSDMAMLSGVAIPSGLVLSQQAGRDLPAGPPLPAATSAPIP